MKLRTFLALVMVVAALTASTRAGANGDSAGPALAVQGRANATPSVAASGSLVVVAWSAAAPKGGADVYVATSSDEGKSFASPVRVNDGAGSASVSGEQPPRIAIVKSGVGPQPALSRIVVVWTAKSAGGTRIMTAESHDSAKTFRRSVVAPGSYGVGNRGWESIAVTPDGHVDAVWLDHRELVTADAAAPAHHDMANMKMPPTHAPASDSVEKAQLSKLYFADLATGSSRALTGGVCYCCKTSLEAAADGSLYAVWRHVYPGNIRDIAFIMSRDGGKTFAAPVRVSEDKWMLDGCPENGPALALQGTTAHVLWPTLVSGGTGGEPTLALFYASTSDGRTFTPRQRIATQGVPRHPQLAALANGSIAAAWDEAAAGGRQVVVATMKPVAGRPALFDRTVLAADAAQYPALAAIAHGYVVAWVSGNATDSVIRVASRSF